MIATDHYWLEMGELSYQIRMDINCEMTRNNVTEVSLEHPIDDIYKLYIDDENEIRICKAASSIDYLCDCDLNTILAIAEAVNRKFNPIC